MDTDAQQGSPLERATSRPVQRGLRRLSRRSRRLLACVLVPALGVAGFAAFGVSSGASSLPPLGIYLGYENTSGVSSLGDAVGQQPSYAMDYLDGTSWSDMESGAANEAAAWSSSGRTVTFSIPMLPNSGATLADGAAGDYNSYFQTIAQGLVANGEASSILRIGWEFNGSWTAWYADASNASVFVAFWQQIVNTMRAVPGADFKFEWCPDIGSSVGNLANFYPGNAYVDYVAEDVYDQAWGTYPGAAAEFSDLETQSYGLNWLTSFAAQQGEPVALGEWGLGDGTGDAGQSYTDANEQVYGGDDPTFINDMAQWLVTNHVAEATYFDYQSSALSSSENPNSYNALIKDFGPGGVASSSTGSSSAAPAPAPTTTTTTPAPAATTTTTAPAPTTTTTAPPPTTTTTAPPPPATTTTTTPPPAPHTTTTPTTEPTTTTTTTPPPSSSGPPPGSTTTTTLSSNESSAMVGDESSMVFTLTVSPAVDQTVAIYGDWGLLDLCQVTVSTDDGTGTCALSNDELGPGFYLVGAVTMSGPNYTGSFSNFVPVSIEMPT